MKRTARFRATIVTVVALGLVMPGTAHAGIEYFFSIPGAFGQMPVGLATHGARHSLTRISARVQGTNNIWVCVYGADQNNVNIRNTAYYCAYPSDLAEVSLGAILRYPWVSNDINAPSAAYARARSDW